MAIGTFSELQTAIANWPQRSDTTFTNRVTEFIALFEGWFNRNVRCRQMETSASLTPSSGTASLPSDYLAVRRVTWTGSDEFRVRLETQT